MYHSLSATADPLPATAAGQVGSFTAAFSGDTTARADHDDAGLVCASGAMSVTGALLDVG